MDEELCAGKENVRGDMLYGRNLFDYREEETNIWLRHLPESERRKIMGKVVVSVVAVVAVCAGIITKKKKKHYGIIK